MAAIAGGSRKRAYAVAWRNFQSKKNKTWERCVSSSSCDSDWQGGRMKWTILSSHALARKRVRRKLTLDFRWSAAMISPIQRRGTYASRPGTGQAEYRTLADCGPLQFMLVKGTGVTVYSVDGKQCVFPSQPVAFLPGLPTYTPLQSLGSRNLNKAIAEGDEFTINTKDVQVRSGAESTHRDRFGDEILTRACIPQVSDECSLDEYYQVAGRKGGQVDLGLSTSTPAKAVPGYLTRPGQTAGAAAKGTPRAATPAAAVQPLSTERVDRAETPVSASKSWFQPGVKIQKPFKQPGRSPAPATFSSGAARHDSPVPPSKLRERTLPEQRQQEPRRENITGGAGGGLGRDKGKGRAYSVDDDFEDVENSPPSLRTDQPPIAKKPRVESAGSPAAAAAGPPRPARRSAADAAFDFAVSKKRNDDLTPAAARDALARAPPARTRSAPEPADQSDRGRTARVEPLFRSSASPEKKKSTPMIAHPTEEEDASEEEEEEELGDWMQDIELDTELFANDSAEEEKPRVGVGASVSADLGDEEMGGLKAAEETGAGDAVSAARTEGKRTYIVSPSSSCRHSNCDR